MNSTTDVVGALRDLLQFHFGSRGWLVALFWAAAAVALGVFITQIMNLNLRSAVGYVAPESASLSYTEPWLVGQSRRSSPTVQAS
jgi:hypothetical protein